MKKINYIILSSILVLAFLAGCSKLRDENISPVSATIKIHPDGFLKTSSPDFHGKVIQKNSWDMTECKKCHGGDYSGGQADKSCNFCHQGTPEACNVCHGSNVNAAPPKDVNGNKSTSFITVGAHQAHLLGSSLSSGIRCSECHKVPKNYKEPGHIDNTSNAEVVFTDSLANVNTKGRNKALMTITRVNNNQNIECANTYCHGNFTNGNNYTPKWISGSDEAKCGSCHSMPPKAPHIQVVACFACHSATVDQNQRIIDKSKHINGKLEVYGSVRTDW